MKTDGTNDKRAPMGYRITKDARESEMENNMGEVSTMIGNLRNMAIDMGSEIENQNNQLDRINAKVASHLFSLSLSLHIYHYLYLYLYLEVYLYLYLYIHVSRMMVIRF